VPADLLGWNQGHPRLRMSNRSAVRIGGVRGERLDLAVTSGYAYRDCMDAGQGRCVLLLQLGDTTPIALGEGETAWPAR
jgi:hypothetical protein